MRRIGVLAVVLALVALVGCGDDDDEGVAATGDDDVAQSPLPGEDVEGPELGDHWHVAVGFSNCGEELPVLDDAHPDESGIHSHSDGLIHVHPFTNAVTGEGAVLARFFDTVGAELTPEGLVTPDWTLPLEGECNGEPARLTLVVWPLAAGGGELQTVTELHDTRQLEAVRLAPDGGAIAIALATRDQEIERPPSAAGIDSPSDIASESTVPSATGHGTPADVSFGLAPVLGTADPCGETATPAADGPECYELGPVSVGADAIASADAEFMGGWFVRVVLTTAGDEAFDSAATACFNRSAECPTGMLAIVVDGEVVSAPQVMEPTFDGELQISGDYDEAEAKALAEALSP